MVWGCYKKTRGRNDNERVLRTCAQRIRNANTDSVGIQIAEQPIDAVLLSGPNLGCISVLVVDVGNQVLGCATCLL